MIQIWSAVALQELFLLIYRNNSFTDRKNKLLAFECHPLYANTNHIEISGQVQIFHHWEFIENLSVEICPMLQISQKQIYSKAKSQVFPRVTELFVRITFYLLCVRPGHYSQHIKNELREDDVAYLSDYLDVEIVRCNY